MEVETRSQRLHEGVSWLIGLRWVATVWVCVGTLFASRLLRISVQEDAILRLVGVLALCNIVYWLMSRYRRRGDGPSVSQLKQLIGIQMTGDLLLLTIIFHYSGGIENPFIFFYVFHVLIASILLSVKESCFQATVGVFLFGGLVFLEYEGKIPHYCLTGFVSHSLHHETVYVFGTLFGFATAMYLVVYLGGFVAERLRRAEIAQNQANEELREKDRIKDEYVYRVSHNIKGHLAAIQSCLSVVQTEGISQAERDGFVQRSLIRTRGLTQFVKDLLHLTYVRLNDKIEAERFSLDHVVRHAMDVVEPNAQDRSIALDCNMPETPVFMYGSVLVIEEVITNLLTNAIKYTHVGGTITLSVTTLDEGVRVQIVDTGIGIPAEELGRVFEEFYRASNTRQIDSDGSGMGLALVKHIVESHGGTIVLTSQLGIGTEVCFTLPYSPPNGLPVGPKLAAHVAVEEKKNSHKNSFMFDIKSI